MRTRTKWTAAALSALIGTAVPIGIEASAAGACTPATVSVYGGSQLEGTGSKDTAFVFTVSVTTGEGVCAPVGTVDYRTVDGNGQPMPAQYIAQVGSDYAGQSGRLSFNGDPKSQFIVVKVAADAVPEDDEAFSIQLSAPTGQLRLGGSKGTFWVRDDDTHPPLDQPVFEIQDGEICWSSPTATPSAQPSAAARASTEDTSIWQIPVELSRPSDRPVTVHYKTFQTSPGWQGYVPVQDAVITFAKGSTRGYAEVKLLPNPNYFTSSFGLQIFEPSAGRIAFGRTEVLINPGG